METQIGINKSLISRDQARAIRLKRYFSGQKCGRGHVSERYVKNSLCITCHQIQGARKYTERREEILASQRERRENNGDHVLSIERAWYARNAETKIRACEAWWKNNPDKRRAKHRRRHNTIRGNLNSRISRRINECLKAGKGGVSWTKLVPYSLDQLKLHIERQFFEGMSWDNRNLWHIDHIVPLSSFIFTSAKDQEFQSAWALSNLRPLWKEKNLTKRDKREFLI